MPKYMLAEDCIDMMHEQVKESAGEDVITGGAAEAVLRQDLPLRLKQSLGDEGIQVTVPAGTVLNFFRHEAPAQAPVTERKSKPRNLGHFFVRVGEHQYTFEAGRNDSGVVRVAVTAIRIPRSQIPSGTTGAPAHRVFTG